jgi:ABC-type multidrug transport system ATPase subunit
MTIFLTTQYLEEADRLADEVAIINRGRIVAQGRPSDLKRSVGDEVVEIEFADGEAAARADAVLAPLAGQRKLAGSELRLYVPRAAEVVPELVRRLDAAALPPAGLTLSQATLDDVFLRATGETMKEAEGDGPDEPRDPEAPDAKGEATA